MEQASRETPAACAEVLHDVLRLSTGSSWHLQIGDPQGRKQRPIPLQPGSSIRANGGLCIKVLSAEDDLELPQVTS